MGNTSLDSKIIEAIYNRKDGEAFTVDMNKVKRVKALVKLERAKLFEQIRSEVIKTANPAGVDMTCARLLKAEQREALTRLEKKYITT